MFSSSYFDSSYFSDHFKLVGEIIVIPSTAIRSNMMETLDLTRDDRELLEVIISFVMTR